MELHSTLIILNPHVASISKTDRKYIIFTSLKLFFFLVISLRFWFVVLRHSEDPL